jgi:tetratricopeptide (TPR) repeat protein
MNRIAGYSCYEKNPPDYNKALSYMETLFQTVAPERIIQKDYLYLARILSKKNLGYPKMVEDLSSLKSQLEKAKTKPAADELNAKIANAEKEVAKADAELERMYVAYGKALSYKPEDKNLLNEIANSYYNNKRFDMAAKTWAKLLDPSKDNTEDLMRIGRAYYNGEKLKTADSLFSSITKVNPSYLPAHLWIARTYSKMDPDTKLGLAKPKFEKVAEVGKTDSVKYENEMMEAFNYLSYYHMMNENWNKSKEYYNRMINLDPTSKENKLKGYYGIGSIELRSTKDEKTNEGRLPYLSRATEAFNKMLAIDPANASAKSQLAYVREFEAQVKKGINPNEIKGVIKSKAGQPIGYASVRVKDTAAETLTNAKGEYKFEIPQDSEILLVVAKGYKSLEIPITKSRVYNVTLEQ